MTTDFDANVRKIKGATAQEEPFAFSACPESLTALIKETDLCDLIYWKLLMDYENLDTKSSCEVLKSVQKQVERPLFAFVLKKTKGNQSKAAEILGCNRNTLHRKLKDFSVEPKVLRKALNPKRRIQKAKEFKIERSIEV